MDVWLWSYDESFGIADVGNRSRVTEVFRRTARPKIKALLLALSHEQQETIVAVGFAGRAQQIATGKDRLTIESLERIEPIPLGMVAEHLNSRFHGPLYEAGGQVSPLHGVPLSDTLGAQVIEVLRTLSSGVSEALDRRSAALEPVRGALGATVREQRDAVSLAFDLARFDTTVADVQVPASIDGETRAGYLSQLSLVARDNEDDLITADLMRFDPSGTIQQLAASQARFTDRSGFALTITNVNRKPLEHVLGVDLVYYDHANGAYTLIQYKRFDRVQQRTATGTKQAWAYTRRGEIEKALALMDVGAQQAQGSADWRMTGSPFWFKFLREDAFTPGDMGVLRGMYVPADYLRLALTENTLNTGPSGGFRIDYDNTRYVTRAAFVDLVKRGLVGTTTNQTSRVQDVIAQLAEDRDVIVAIKTPLPDDRYAGNAALDEEPF